jgi:hypothetical protein
MKDLNSNLSINKCTYYYFFRTKYSTLCLWLNETFKIEHGDYVFLEEIRFHRKPQHVTDILIEFTTPLSRIDNTNIYNRSMY